MIRVLVADDHALVRQGIRAVLERSPRIDIVAEVASGPDAVEAAASATPDVAVIDVTMPGMSGIEVAERILASGGRTAVVILSMHEDDAVIDAAVRAGARGYVLKGSVAEELLHAVEVAARGGMYLSKAASRSEGDLEAGQGTEPARTENPLTHRERQVLALIGAGHINRAVAAELGISVKTVERHRTSIMNKLDVHSVVELVREGIKLGIITLDG